MYKKKYVRKYKIRPDKEALHIDGSDHKNKLWVPNGKPQFDTMMKKLEYFDQIIYEAFRLYPPGLTWRWRHFSYFRRTGIPGPKPNKIWGNIMEYHSMDHYKVIGRWLKEYGDTFDFYDGDVPFVVTMDLDLLETISVHYFSNFTGRGLTMMVEKMHPFLGNAIIFTEGCQWKNVRNTLASGFSAAKLKLMMPLLEDNVTVLLSLLEKHAKLGEEVDILRKFEQLALDFVFRGAFGFDERFQGNPGHPFEEIAKSAGRKLMAGPLHMIAQSTTMFGSLAKPLSWLSLVLDDVDKVTRETARIIEVRRTDRTYRKPDILQNLLDAELVEDGEREEKNRGTNKAAKPRSLTTAEVITGAVTLFVAGYETIATSLSYLTFVLAKYPDVQEKVRQEIQESLDKEGKLQFDTIMKRLEYFDQVIYETFRLYPPGLTFVTRQAKRGFEYKGTHFKAGTCFMAPLYQIQRDPRFWLDPLRFDPDRFAPEHQNQVNKMAYLAFGTGPRNCVGKSTAILKLKLTLSKLLQRYRLELGPSQLGEMELSSRAMLSTPVRGPWIIFHRLKKPL